MNPQILLVLLVAASFLVAGCTSSQPSGGTGGTQPAELTEDQAVADIDAELNEAVSGISDQDVEGQLLNDPLLTQ